jgi:nucleotide-binding universal stress UspA family protein
MSDTSLDRPEIVVGVDGSPGSLHALSWAVDHAPAFGARVRVVCAWHFTPEPAGYLLAPPVVTPDDQRRAAERTAAEARARYDEGPVEVVADTVEDVAWRALCDAAKGALMLVVGSRGHGMVTGALLGSVAQRCATHASCPVLVVPPPDTLS